MKPFDLEQAKAGAKLVTRDGDVVSSFKEHDFGDMNPQPSYTCEAIINDVPHWYTVEGRYIDEHIDDENDLFLADEQ